MTGKNPRIGSTFESWLGEQGVREEVTAAAIEEVIAEQLAAEMKREEEASLDESLAQAERGELATDEQMRAIWAKHGL